MDTPVLGVHDTYDGPDRWQVSTTWRYQRSDLHFVGSDEQEERTEEGSEVINTIHLMEVAIRYNASPKWSFTLGIPYLLAERSSPIRDANRVVIDRSLTQARGVGDLTLTARRLLLEPDNPKGFNISFGGGIKLPTGENNVVDTRRRQVNGQIVNAVETVDQSIQPGDGGFGVALDLQGAKRLGGNFVGYLSMAYLINPENTNGVPTFRTQRGEEIMSVADQYLARLGATYSPASKPGLTFGLGGRLEGVPVEDLIGDSDGFRRPGYAVSAEPSVSYSKGPHGFSLAVPWALYRNRTRSVPDRANNRHGDAAFADYIISVGYSRRF